MGLRILEKALLVGTAILLLCLLVQLHVVKEVRSPLAKPEHTRLGDYPDTQQDLRKTLGLAEER